MRGGVFHSRWGGLGRGFGRHFGCWLGHDRPRLALGFGGGGFGRRCGFLSGWLGHGLAGGGGCFLMRSGRFGGRRFCRRGFLGGCRNGLFHSRFFHHGLFRRRLFDNCLFRSGLGHRFAFHRLDRLGRGRSFAGLLGHGLGFGHSDTFFGFSSGHAGSPKVLAPADGRFDDELVGRVAQTWTTCSPGVAPKASPFAQHWARAIVATGRAADQTRHLSRPWKKISLGKSKPMKTILLLRTSSAAQAGPRSLPISWCTPWKMTLRSVPFMNKTPL